VLQEYQCPAQVLAIERDLDLPSANHLVHDLSHPHGLILDRDPARLPLHQRVVPLMRCHTSRQIEVSCATDRAGPALWRGAVQFVVELLEKSQELR
jgi:hypothetical protein